MQTPLDDGGQRGTREKGKPARLAEWARRVIKQRVRETAAKEANYARSIRAIRDPKDGLTRRMW